MDHLNPVPDRNGNLIGFVGIILAVVGVILFVQAKIHIFISDRDRLSELTSSFLSSLPDPESHFALKSTTKSRNKARNLLAQYRISEAQIELVELEEELASVLSDVGEQYLRFDGVALGYEFHQQHLDRSTDSTAAGRASLLLNEVVFNESQFSLSGDLKFRNKIKSLTMSVEFLKDLERAEIGGAVYAAFQFAAIYSSLMEPRPISTSPDYQSVVRKVEEFRAQIDENFTDVSLFLFMYLGDLLTEEYRLSGSLNDKALALEVYQKIPKTLDGWADKNDVDLASWGVSFTNMSELTGDIGLGYSALEKCTKSWDQIAPNGLMEWGYAQICLAYAHRNLANLTKELQHLTYARETLEQFLEVLEPNQHKYLWAETQLAIGKVYSSNTEIPFPHESMRRARTACSNALDIFQGLKHDWYEKSEQNCLKKLATDARPS